MCRPSFREAVHQNLRPVRHHLTVARHSIYAPLKREPDDIQSREAKELEHLCHQTILASLFVWMHAGTSLNKDKHRKLNVM